MNLDLSRQRPAFDALCVTALRHELQRSLVGGAIQRVEVGGNELSLEIYAGHVRRRLFCHVGDDASRFHLTTQKSEASALVESPMLLQLRKHVRGGRVAQISQPRLERLLRLEVTTKEDGELRTCALIIETMGRRSNAILVDSDGRILEALRRTPPSRSPQRPVLPRMMYQAPPPQDRLDPMDAHLADELETAALDQADNVLVADIVWRSVSGISPGAGREAVFRATSAINTTIGRLKSWNEVAMSVRSLVESVESGDYHPHVACHDEVPIFVSPYRPSFLDGLPGVRLQTHETMSGALEAAFSVMATAARVRITRSAADVARKIREALDVEHRRESSLAREIPSHEDVERLRLYGEAIFASLSSIPPGAETLEFNGLTVPLDPPHGPVDVANEYFADYRRRRDAAARVPALQQESAGRVEYLESLLAMAEASDSQSGHRAIARELEAFLGSAPENPKKRRRVTEEPQPRRFQSPDGFTILVGTNGVMNERVTFKAAAADDLWFHARGEPGAHVVLRTGSRSPSQEAIQTAANLAARFSRGRASGSVPVDHTLVRNVRKIRGAPPGLVRYVNEQTVIGHPDDVE
ncbi:MAG TPA: NFACT family protein [Chloroflexota bacterium]|jgi:predicted ribosome quality control (RQC) complex YloA/Tae2 family protein|nr:NFACT family protein [Chloroflexota bacterium]